MKGIYLHLLILGVLAAAAVARPSQQGAMAKEGADIVQRQDRGMVQGDARQLLAMVSPDPTSLSIFQGQAWIYRSS